MSYLSSNTVRMFPSTKRGSTDRSAREFSEENITGIIQHVYDMDSFIISCAGDPNKTGAINWLQDAGPLEFIIHGYYFKILNVATFISSMTSDTLMADATSLWACIYLNQDGYIQIQGQDDNSLYQGLSIEKNLSNPVPGEVVGGLKRYCLQLFTRDSASTAWTTGGKIPSTSYAKNNLDSFAGEIDGGSWNYNATNDKTIGSLDLNSKVYRG